MVIWQRKKKKKKKREQVKWDKCHWATKYQCARIWRLGFDSKSQPETMEGVRIGIPVECFQLDFGHIRFWLKDFGGKH